MKKSGLTAHRAKRAIKLIEGKRIPEGLSSLRQLIEAAPRNPDGVHLASQLVRALGWPHQAHILARRAVDLAPDRPDIVINLVCVMDDAGQTRAAAKLLGDSGRRSEAGIARVVKRAREDRDRLGPMRALFKREMEGDWTGVEHWQELSALLSQVGCHRAAARCLRRVLDMAPDNAALARELVLTLCRLHEHYPAMRLLDEFLARWPREAWIHAARGDVSLSLDRVDDATRSFEEAIRLAPDLAAAHVGLGDALKRTGDERRSAESHQQGLTLAPRDPDVLVRVGAAQLGRGLLDDAERNLRLALQLRPADPRGTTALAMAMERRGAHRAALARLLPVIEGDDVSPTAAMLHGRLCQQLGTPEEGLPLLRQVLQGAQSPAICRELYHALGVQLEALGDHRGAFEAHANANELSSDRFDPGAFEAEAEKIITAFSAQSLRRWPRALRVDSTPILVVGLPHAGATLVETLLGAHPAIEPGGESQLLPRLAKAMADICGTEHWIPALDKVSSAQLGRLSRSYLDRVRATRRRATRITDRTVSSASLLGFAAMVLPGARIVHCRRDTADTCLSAYFAHHTGRFPYAARLGWLGAVHRVHARLMNHWRTHLALSILEIDYEELVTNPERVLRRLIGFCDLKWSPDVLRGRVAGQARARRRRVAPLVVDRIGRAEQFEPWLGPLREALAEGDPER